MLCTGSWTASLPFESFQPGQLGPIFLKINVLIFCRVLIHWRGSVGVIPRWGPILRPLRTEGVSGSTANVSNVL